MPDVGEHIVAVPSVIEVAASQFTITAYRTCGRVAVISIFALAGAEFNATYIYHAVSLMRFERARPNFLDA